jgi:hypothetical protein
MTAPAYSGPEGNIHLETFSLGDLPLDAVTFYWFQLGNAVNSYINPRSGERIVAWDDSSAFQHRTTIPGNDATAYQFNLNVGGPSTTYPSDPQSFQILGSADTALSAVPEPSSVLLLATMLAGLGVVIRRKLLA